MAKIEYCANAEKPVIIKTSPMPTQRYSVTPSLAASHFTHPGGRLPTTQNIYITQKRHRSRPQNDTPSHPKHV